MFTAFWTKALHWTQFEDVWVQSISLQPGLHNIRLNVILSSSIHSSDIFPKNVISVAGFRALDCEQVSRFSRQWSSAWRLRDSVWQRLSLWFRHCGVSAVWFEDLERADYDILAKQGVRTSQTRQHFLEFPLPPTCKCCKTFVLFWAWLPGHAKVLIVLRYCTGIANVD